MMPHLLTMGIYAVVQFSAVFYQIDFCYRTMQLQNLKMHDIPKLMPYRV